MRAMRMFLLAAGLVVIGAGGEASTEQSVGTASNVSAVRPILDLASQAALIFKWSQNHVDVLRDLALAQAAAGDSQGALKNLAFIQELKKTAARDATKDLADKRLHRILGAIAMVQMRLGAAAEADKTIRLDLPDKARIDEFFWELATAQTKSGDSQGGLKFGSFIADDFKRAEAIAGVVRDSRARPDVVQQAVQTTPHRERLIHFIAEAQAEAGDVPGALRTASTLGPGERDLALGFIARGLAKNGDIGRAVETLSSVREERSLKDATTMVADEIVRTMPKVANLTAAMKVGETLPETSRVRLWPSLALLLGREGRIQEVRGLHARFRKSDPALLQAVEVPWWGNVVFGRALAKAGAVPDALQIVQDLQQVAREVSDENLKKSLQFGKFRVLEEIVAAQIKSADFAGALRTADTMWDRQSQSDTVRREIALGDALAQVRDDEQLRRGIRFFFKDSGKHDRILAAAVRVRATAGDFRQALGIAALIQTPFSKDVALSNIAIAQAQSGSAVEALKTLQAIQTPSVKEQTLTPVALSQAKSGDAQGAVKTLTLLPALFLQVDAAKVWQDIAFIQTESGDVRGAFVWIADLKDKTARTRALVGVAEGLRTGSRTVPPDALAKLTNKWEKEEGELAAINERARATFEITKKLFEPPPCEKHEQPSTRGGQADLDNAAQLTRRAEELNAKRSRAQALKAIPLAREAVEIRQRVLGPQHSDVAASLTVLGDAYALWGGVHLAGTPAGPAATSVLECALKIREKTLGEDHLDVAETLHRLGKLEVMRPDRGKPLFEQALAIRQKHLAPDHPLVLETQLALARADSRSAPAGIYRIEPLLRKVLANREKIMGPTHPDVEEVLSALFVISLRKGDTQEAEQLGGRLATLRETRYASGEDDDPTIEAKAILGRIRRMAKSAQISDPERFSKALKGLPRPPRYSYWYVVNGNFALIRGGAQDTVPCNVTLPPSPMSLIGMTDKKGVRTQVIAAANGNLDADATCDEWKIYEDGMLNHVYDDAAL